MPALPAIANSPNAQARLNLAFIVNSLPPYRLHFHQRIVREMPGVRLWTLLTHEEKARNWTVDPAVAAAINVVEFGRGESVEGQGRLGSVLHEWAKGARMIRWLREHQPAAVVVLGYGDAGRLRVIRWCNRHNVRCFVWGDSNVRGDLARGVRRLVKRAIVSWVVRSTTGIMVCGRLGAEFFARYGATPQRTWYSPYEPDYDAIQSLAPARVQAIAERFGLAPGRRRIIFSGRFVPVKRVDLAIDAFAAITANRPEWDLVIAGDGELRDGLRARVPAPLISRVIWTGFLSDPSDLAALYLACDVLVLPSDYEPWALVVNEAAAAGLAIVSSDVVGAAAELVRDGKNGRLFPQGDLSALTQCLREVTAPAAIDQTKAVSRPVLNAWRAAGDPIAGLAAALGLPRDGLTQTDRGNPCLQPSTADRSCMEAR